jgi:hypothetical protein
MGSIIFKRWLKKNKIREQHLKDYRKANGISEDDNERRLREHFKDRWGRNL